MKDGIQERCQTWDYKLAQIRFFRRNLRKTFNELHFFFAEVSYLAYLRHSGLLLIMNKTETFQSISKESFTGTYYNNGDHDS